MNGGRLTLGSNGSHNRIIKTGAVSIVGGQIDLTDNKLATSTTAGAATGGVYPANSVHALVAAGRNGGTWDGANGIITSQSDAQGIGPLTTLAVATASDLGFGGTKTFGGQTVATTNTLVMYTYAGDTNLDGTINGDDYFRMDNAFLSGPVQYDNGDLNYDGKINADDYFIIDRNYGEQTLGTFPQASLPGGVSAVPEPASVMGLGMLGLAAMTRRRRSR
jgi:hypothetical protein